VLSLRRASGLMTTVLLAGAGLIGVTAAPAFAECSDRDPTCGGSDVTQSPGTVSVRVWGTTVNAGSGGSPGIVSSQTVTVSPPCYLTSYITGKEYFKGIKDGSITGAGWDEWSLEPWKPYDGFEQYKDDDKGYWYVPTCVGAPDNSVEFFRSTPAVYVEEGEAPPIPDIPPEMLLEAAMEALDLPEPTVSWNPQIKGTGGTLVRLDTWFWLDGSPRSFELHAAAGGNEVTVTGAVTSMDLSAPTADPVTCDGIGQSWQAGRTDSDCALVFSAPDPATPVDITVNWGLAWSANGQPQGELDPMTSTGSASVPVNEMQTIVRDVG